MSITRNTAPDADPRQVEFGFLQIPLEGGFSGVEITPLSDHKDRLAWLNRHSNQDGFFYPPQVSTYEIDLVTRKRRKKVEKTTRPASVYHLPASHQIFINAPVSPVDNSFGDEALIIHLLAYVYGTRLQLVKWRFDGRVPIKPVHSISITEQTCLDFLKHTYAWWQKLTGDQRIRFVNILYVHTRARSLEWEWDAFIHQYLTFDALFRLHTEIRPSKSKISHRERLTVMCREYGIRNNPGLLDKIYLARNELFHEAMWTGSAIGFDSADKDAFYLPYHLARLNARIISSMVGYTNEYVGSAWWAMGTFLFDRPKMKANKPLQPILASELRPICSAG